MAAGGSIVITSTNPSNTGNLFTVASSAPSSPATGDLWFNSTSNVLETWTGAAWVDPGAPFTPSDQGILAWSYDVAAAATGTVLPTSGQIVLSRINLRTQVSVTNVLYNITTLGGTLTSGENFVGLYNSSGTLIGTSADQTTGWNTGGATGLYTTALSGGPFNAGPGFVWVAWLFNGTTGPSLSRGTNLGNPASVNLGLTAATARHAHASLTGQASLANFTPSASTLTQTTFWAGLS